MQEHDVVYWIRERERVRRAKESCNSPPPWSLDPVFQTTYFCNVRREDDKVTKWIRQNWPHDDIGLVVLARMFNLPSHLNRLRLLPQHAMKSESLRWREAGQKLFNGAYLITTCGVKMDKVDYVYQVAQDAGNLEWDTSPIQTLVKWHKNLMKVNGLGSFLAAQVVADLKNTPGHPLATAPDWWTWCAPGPGSMRGIKWVEGYENTTLGTFAREATTLYNSIAGQLPERLHMQDFQNCLCEFDKYCRVKTGTGRSKRKYNGRESS